ncbi:MAG: hypothetical protein IJK53_09360 [Erysipelotrichaceae bacterium]|nr:hypothetical protein [Clostridia bacterium]MBQ6217574.1 hypothetical protein [Erysipelotrichaceae bacterium]
MAFIDKLLLKLSPKTVIERSRFFDKEWYREKYGIQSDPAAHYLNEGWLKDYDPSSSFSTKDYLINNPDIQGINPLLHYEIYGKNEGRRPFVPKRSEVNDYSAENIEITYETYFKEINDKKVVSFDVFDTLVIRPFVKAEELFEYMEKEFSSNGFSDARKKAESDARKTLNKEVNIDEIYAFIDKKYIDLKEKEIGHEIRFCHLNPLIYPIYEKAKQLGKRVIAVSDMYLPKDIVEKILSAYEMDAIYVSCDFDMTKGSGRLFEYVFKKENIEGKQMIHFGDNYISDYSQAINSGTDAHQTPKIVDHVFSDKAYKYLLSFYKRHDDLASSIFLSRASEYLSSSADKPFFEKLAYILGGPLVLSYLHFVCENAKEKQIDKLLFVSRDGYCLKEVYEKYFYEEYQINDDYAYLSRAAIYSGALENHLTSDLGTILSIAGKDMPEIQIFDSLQENQKEFEKHEEKLRDWSHKRSRGLAVHLNTLAEGCDKLATVDMFSGNYTSQKGAAYYLKEKVKTGFYAGNFANQGIEHLSFSDRLLGMRDNLPVKMSEFLVTSYEPPIIGVDGSGKPIYEYPEKEERKERYEQILNGILGYIGDQRRFFKENSSCQLSLEEWIDLADSYLKECDGKDIAELSKILDSENPVSGESDKTISELIRLYREQGY